MKKYVVAFIAVAMLASMIGGVFAQCCCAPGFTPGFWKHNIGVYIGVAEGAQSAFEGGPYDGQKADAFLDTVGWDTAGWQAVLDVLSARGGGEIAQARADAANALNAMAGYGPFID